MARVCLISPGHLATNPRLVKEARSLQGAGYDVSILHGRYKSEAVETDQTIAREFNDVRSVHFGRFEADRGQHLKQWTRRRIALKLLERGAASDWLSSAAHSPIGLELEKAALDCKADLYIAHYVAALPAAALAAKRHSGRYSFDAEDFHLGDLLDLPQHILEKNIIRSIEARHLPGAAYVTAASPLIAEAYSQEYGIARPEVILNVFPRGGAATRSTPKGLAEPGPSLYWFSQTIGPGRGLETAIEAIARSRSKPHFFLRGAPAKGYAERLTAFASSLQIAERVHFLPVVDPDCLEQLGAMYDLGFVGELPETRNHQKALANKLFSYLSSGLAIAASDIPAHRDICPRLGHAVRTFRAGDADSLAAIIDSFLLDASALAAARQHAWQLGQHEYCWETQAEAFLRRVRAATEAMPRT